VIYIRLAFFLIGLATFSLGLTITIKVQYLGLHPWDVLAVGLYDIFGLSMGSWNIIVSCTLIVISLLLDRTYVKWGTFFIAIVTGFFIDTYLWLDFLPDATHTWTDWVIILTGIVIMGVGGGLYNSAGLGAGPRDGFMLSMSDKTGIAVGKMRIITETVVLGIGLLIGGPVFIFTFIFTFIQSPIFQYLYFKGRKFIVRRGAVAE
jgi:hypothetical protein